MPLWRVSESGKGITTPAAAFGGQLKLDRALRKRVARLRGGSRRLSLSGELFRSQVEVRPRARRNNLRATSAPDGRRSLTKFPSLLALSQLVGFDLESRVVTEPNSGGRPYLQRPQWNEQSGSGQQRDSGALSRRLGNARCFRCAGGGSRSSSVFVVVIGKGPERFRRAPPAVERVEVALVKRTTPFSTSKLSSRSRRSKALEKREQRSRGQFHRADSQRKSSADWCGGPRVLSRRRGGPDRTSAARARLSVARHLIDSPPRPSPRCQRWLPDERHRVAIAHERATERLFVRATRESQADGPREIVARLARGTPKARTSDNALMNLVARKHASR